jgi:hypothetical protein
VVLVVEPLSMPPFHRSFEGELQKVIICASLEAESADYLVLCGTRLIFQEEVVFQKGKILR